MKLRFFAAGIGLISFEDALRNRIPSYEEMDRRYRAKLISDLNESQIDHAAILAFDGVYDSFGRLNHDKTAKYVRNEAVAELCAENPKMLFVASINPARADCLPELDRCDQSGAVMIKWLPSVMGFDPANDEYLPFYGALKERRIPLLVHIGFEWALPVVNDDFCNLDRLEYILQTGVTVVAAHCCGGRPFVDSKKDFARMVALIDQYPNLYLDVSGMASLHRKDRLMRSLRSPYLQERLVFGTDFPVPVQESPFAPELRSTRTQGTGDSNYFDQYLHIMRSCGLTKSAECRGYSLLRSL